MKPGFSFLNCLWWVYLKQKVQADPPQSSSWCLHTQAALTKWNCKVKEKENEFTTSRIWSGLWKLMQSWKWHQSRYQREFRFISCSRQIIFTQLTYSVTVAYQLLRLPPTINKKPSSKHCNQFKNTEWHKISEIPGVPPSDPTLSIHPVTHCHRATCKRKTGNDILRQATNPTNSRSGLWHQSLQVCRRTGSLD